MNDLYDIDCVRPIQSSVIQTIHCKVGPKCFFFQFYQNVCYYHYAYFIDISQVSAERHLWCGGMCNNHITANCLQSVLVKEF